MCIELRVHKVNDYTPWKDLPVITHPDITMSQFYMQRVKLINQYKAQEIRANNPGSAQGHYINRAQFLGHDPELYYTIQEVNKTP